MDNPQLNNQSKPKKPKQTNVIAILILVAVLLMVIIIAGYCYFIPADKENKNTNQVVVNTNINDNQNANLNQNTNGTIVVNGNANTNVNSNVNANTNTSVNGNLNTNTAINMSGWKTYTNNTYGYSIKYPKAWSLDNDRSKESDIVFYIGREVGESREAIKVETTSNTLEQWKNSFDPTIVIKTSNLSIDGYEAIRVDTGEFATSYMGIKKGDKLYIIYGAQIFDNGMYSTFQFSDVPTGWKSVTVDKSYWGDSFPGTFTLKYPESWKDSKSLEGYRVSNKESYTYGLGAQPDDIFIFSIRWQKKSSETDLAKACKNYNDAVLTRNITNAKDMEVSGIKAYLFDYTVSANQSLDAEQTCLFAGDYLVIFLGSKLESSLISNYGKILSTFQFTDY